MDADAILALALLLVASVASLSWTPLGRALIAWLRRPAAPLDPAASRDVLDELRDLRREVTELSERMDFTERLLAKERDAGRLKGAS